jgi:hypothetical protein
MSTPRHVMAGSRERSFVAASADEFKRKTQNSDRPPCAQNWSQDFIIRQFGLVVVVVVVVVARRRA